ncbi:tumor necrosis factor ligand superfamily member 6 [Myiozetetes cayanensis]|uniref:tumor necrosis factor ligand superfamily member 6 n=1 Tax=Myiozetetes cayanensis TaxID=478635 RepID=UPI00215E116C|nr:tumor necrosis factor ligand superfamily member 6 [Myiozetetes cayanensis]
MPCEAAKEKVRCKMDSGMQAYKGRAGSSPRAQPGTTPAVFGCHMEDDTKRVQPIPLPAMQQNLNYVYPPIFWVDGCAETSTSCPSAPPVAPFPPPVPDRRRKPGKNRERKGFDFLVIYLLLLLAFTGVGLSMFRIFQLEKELAELRESASAEHIPPALEKLIGQKESMKKEERKAAHLTGSPSQQGLPLEWEPISGHAYTSDIQYRDRGLVINETGLYFVYSNVLFRGSVCDGQVLTHIVYKRNPTSPGSHVLMEDKGINYCTGQRTWARKSNLGALFSLRKMDSVHVNVSKIALVNFEESKTFFGLFKL